jgi:hypothetical protein
MEMHEIEVKKNEKTNGSVVLLVGGLTIYMSNEEATELALNLNMAAGSESCRHRMTVGQ